VTDHLERAEKSETNSGEATPEEPGQSASHDWRIFRQNADAPHDAVRELPEPPPWRPRRGSTPEDEPHADDESWRASVRGRTFKADSDMELMVNAALYLRRPLLITGPPGTGKSSLIEAVAWQLRLGPVLRWPITSRSTLGQALYSYDAIGRLQEVQINRKRAPDIGKYITLGPLGTALVPRLRPRPLLIDEIDKSDIDLPNDLLNILEDGEFEIPELARLESDRPVEVRLTGSARTHPITRGKVTCWDFPFVVMTSNREREFPPAFLRRCLRLEMEEPKADQLKDIVEAHLGKETRKEAEALTDRFFDQRSKGALATDQLLNAVFLVMGRTQVPTNSREDLIEALWQHLALTPPK
jgi:MoxR-like ATPase